jgi:RNA polymerase sigma-70 factor (family 1)
MIYAGVADEILLKLVSAGDEQAFRTLYLRHWNKLFNTSKKRLGDENVAAEIVQDIFVELWAKRTHLEIQVLERYLYQSVKFRVIDYYRASLVRQKYATLSTTASIYEEAIVENDLALQDLHEAVERGLELLPVKTREIFRLNRLEDKSVPEISENLRIPERTVEYHITKSLKVLRTYLREYPVHQLFFVMSGL